MFYCLCACYLLYIYIFLWSFKRSTKFNKLESRYVVMERLGTVSVPCLLYIDGTILFKSMTHGAWCHILDHTFHWKLGSSRLIRMENIFVYIETGATVRTGLNDRGNSLSEINSEVTLQLIFAKFSNDDLTYWSHCPVLVLPILNCNWSPRPERSIRTIIKKSFEREFIFSLYCKMGLAWFKYWIYVTYYTAPWLKECCSYELNFQVLPVEICLSLIFYLSYLFIYRENYEFINYNFKYFK